MRSGAAHQREDKATNLNCGITVYSTAKLKLFIPKVAGVDPLSYLTVKQPTPLACSLSLFLVLLKKKKKTELSLTLASM